ncbi:hypothetical protein HK102_007894 [Quaeritorhiza haematococci]|nr:hypothetical protein HK102_007894 [Quaeritorhiza haematococci]
MTWRSLVCGLLLASASSWSPLTATVGAASVQVPLIVEGASFSDSADTKKFLEHVNRAIGQAESEVSEATWAYETDITDENQRKSTEAELKYNQILLDILKEAPKYTGKTEDEKRMLKMIMLRGGIPNKPEDQQELSELQAKMVAIYSTARYKGMALEPELTEVLAKSRDYNELLDAYNGWRTVTGPKIKPLYEKFINVSNVGARDGGFEDTSVLWRAGYDMSVDEFTSMIQQVWEQVLPLYEQLHCYTKGRLMDKYGKDKFGDDGLIPAHLLGNMWSQDWSNIYDLLIPYPDVQPIEITPELVKQGYDAAAMHKLSENFYVSLGYDHLPKTFWEKSMIVKPKDREVVCHASAWDFGNDDLRIKMCTVVTGEDLLVVHHEQGHLYYDHYYRHQPALYRGGASDFFHEAIGDTMVLSVVVPSHLKKIGLLPKDDPPKNVGTTQQHDKQTINYQMAVALSKISILPWAYLIDLWRWSVMKGDVTPDQYQESWLALVRKYQGLKRPVPSQLGDFDAGAKYHVPANVPYVRYFGAAVIQFQFHEALCKAAGHKGPIHECSIYENKKAGTQFREMLEMGASKPWQEAIKVATGGMYDKLDGRPLVEYFEPLLKWLKEQNQGRQCGWKGE